MEGRYSEEESRTKWCPMIRNSYGGNCQNDTPKISYGNYCCIASDCMMWKQYSSEGKGECGLA